MGVSSNLIERRAFRLRFWLGVLVLVAVVVARADDTVSAVAADGLWTTATAILLLLLLTVAALVPAGLSRDRRVVATSLGAGVAAFLVAVLLMAFAG